jgi:hypothetical protein
MNLRVPLNFGKWAVKRCAAIPARPESMPATVAGLAPLVPYTFGWQVRQLGDTDPLAQQAGYESSHPPV